MSSGGCRASTGGRTAVELRESAADGAVHELPEPAGARRYG